MERNFSMTLNKTIMKNIARRATPLATQDIKKDIEDEIESGDGVVNPVNIMGTIDEDATGEDGNPNSNLGKTFKTNQAKEDDEVKKKKKEE